MKFLLNKVPNAKIFTTNDPSEFEKIKRPSPTFHAKIYSFLGGNGEVSAVGSDNLTESAMTTNTEALSIFG